MANICSILVLTAAPPTAMMAVVCGAAGEITVVELTVVASGTAWPLVFFASLKIRSGVDTGDTRGPWAFALVLAFFGARMMLWSRQIEDI